MYFEQATWIVVILGAIMLIASPVVFQFAKDVKPQRIGEGYHPLEHTYLGLFVLGSIFLIGGGFILFLSVLAEAIL